ncbi:restriction endonuclease subunit S, partial [Leuconostoc pseudomesenteroides]|uniref:restriction endonuclease subunit S n=1 Tax=Leuconostoc pseudomesenteroides TaxID=33968 RepID=UPI0039EBFF1F
QQMIGSLFKQLDNLTAQNERKIDLLKQLKQAYLQQIFSQELRFAGFRDDWKQRKLGNYMTIPNKEKVIVKSTSDLMTVKLNLGGVEEGSNRETLSLGSTIYYKRKAGQFIYGKQNFFNGSMAIIPDNFDGKATSGDVPSLNINNIVVDYLYTYVSRNEYWRSKEASASGTGSKRIHEATLQNFEISVPSFDEQQKIGSLFKQLDNLITLNQQKLNLLKKQKQAFLQKMFI